MRMNARSASCCMSKICFVLYIGLVAIFLSASINWSSALILKLESAGVNSSMHVGHNFKEYMKITGKNKLFSGSDTKALN